MSNYQTIKQYQDDYEHDAAEAGLSPEYVPALLELVEALDVLDATNDRVWGMIKPLLTAENYQDMLNLVPVTCMVRFRIVDVAFKNGWDGRRHDPI